MTSSDAPCPPARPLLRATGHIAAGGLEGPYEQLVAPDDGRFVTRYALGPARIERGHDGRVAWMRHPNGEVVVQDAEAARRQAVTEAFLHARGWLAPHLWDARLAPTAPAEDADPGCRTLHAEPARGLPVTLTLDASDGRLLVARMVVNGIAHLRRLDDYRWVAGAWHAHLVVTGTGDPSRDVVVRIDRFDALPAADASTDADPFAPPEARMDDLRFAPGVTHVRLPAEVVNGHLFVTARVDGHPMRLMLDTGGVNLLDHEAARRAGLDVAGRLETRGPGRAPVSAGLARGRELALGDGLSLDAPLFRVLPLDELSAVEGVRIDGLLGLELFQRLVVTLDADQAVVTLQHPQAFVPPAGAVSLPLAFHAHVPAVRASVDDVPGEFWLDTGNRNAVTLWAPFAHEHGFAARAGQAPEETVGWGLGGPVPGRVLRGRVLAIGPWSLAAPVITLPGAEEGVTATRHVAGNLGMDLLRRFTATFDHGRRQVHLVPGRALDAPFHEDAGRPWRRGDASAATGG